jgi:hypothetical protein
MENTMTCFVIIGYGKKPSYAGGKLRMLDLDETYTVLIKPAFDALQIPCYRAIDKNLSGSIDKLMLEEIKNADIALVDISTLNANVMWELGVRHALKPRHTIMICEKEQMNNAPFDINHFIIHQYAHSEEGIPYKEVDRFRNQLMTVVKGVLDDKTELVDSPVFTFLAGEVTKTPVDAVAGTQTEESFAGLMTKAEQAKEQKDFKQALELFGKAKEYAKNNMTLKENVAFIIGRQALCTYKSKIPNEQEALIKAKIILDELNPNESNDIEVLGLTGAINKRLYELTNDIAYLDNAILSYEKGFQLKQDYYNGINAAFMNYKKAGLLKTQHKEWDDTKLKADYFRNAVLDIALKLENDSNFSARQDSVWVLLSIAEAYNYKGDNEKLTAYEEKAKQVAAAKNDTFAISSYTEQKNKIDEIKINLN